MFDYPFHIGDYVTSTAHLSNEEDLSYRRMIDLYYQKEQPLCADDGAIARRIRMPIDIVKIILAEFFTLSEDGYHNGRCDREIARYRKRVDDASRAGKVSAQRRSNKSDTDKQRPLNDRSTTVQRSSNDRATNQLPNFPTSQLPKEENTPLTPPASGGRKKKCLNYEDDENFTYFWDQYRMPEGREKGSKKKAFAEWRNLSLTHQEYAFYMLDIYLAETNKNDNGRYRKQVYLYLKDRLWEQFDVPESIRKKITNDGGNDE